MTPKRNQYWLLDSVVGWRSSALTGLSFTADGDDVMLDPLPGSAVFVDAALVSETGWPVALAAARDGRILVLDAATSRVVSVDFAAQNAQTITGFGGKGTGLRSFRSPRGLAVLPSGSIAIADTGNQRVQLFSASPWALLQVWTVQRPVAVAADGCGIVYVLDAARSVVLRFRPDGATLGDIGTGLLHNLSELAVSSGGDVAAVDGAAIVVFPAKGGEPWRVDKVPAPASLAFDDAGNLYVGTANGTIAKLEPDRNDLQGYRLGGEGVTDVDGTVAKLLWTASLGLVAILRNTGTASAERPAAPRLARIDPAGAFRLQGTLETQPLDSGIEKCVWHRVQVVGTVPQGASVLVESATSEAPDGAWAPARQCTLAGADNFDCLVQSVPGRYLKLRFTLRSSGETSPRLHAIKVFFPRESYLQYLPAVFQDDDESRLFLDRFLSLFQTSFDDLDGRIDQLWELFDPFATPDRYFPWLAGWLALPLDPSLSAPEKRRLLSGAFRSYLLRGTVAGLEQAVADYAGVPDARVLEHFRLRNWARLTRDAALDEGTRLWSRNFYARLQVGVTSRVGAIRLTDAPEPPAEPLHWGANRFSVLFPAHPYRVDGVKTRVQRVVEREKPAHAEAILCPVFPRLRVGIQATLGVDAVVGEVNRMLLGRVSTLSYDSVLACSPAQRDARRLGQNIPPRLGVDSTIL